MMNKKDNTIKFAKKNGVTALSKPVDLDAMNLKHIILQVVHCIPEGKVATYGQIAELAGVPRAARLAGNALKSLPPASTIPWHRVINAQGRISLPESNPSYKKQLQRLRSEGVLVKNKRINLTEYRWNP